MPQPLTVSHTFTADGYRSLADLSGLLGSRVRLSEGSIQAQSNPITVRFGDATTPAATAAGTELAVRQAIGFGPAPSPEAAWPLDRIWVRNASAGVNGTVVATGMVL